MRYAEGEIIQLLRDRSTRAIDIIYRQYIDALYGVVVRIVASDQVAEDVIQESFVKIWQNAGSYDPSKGRLFTWLVNICRNTAIDVTRSKGFRKSQSILGDEKTVVNVAEVDGFQPEQIGLKELVGRLAPEQRLLIDKAYFEGYTQSELAEELNLPLGTVKTRMRAAMKTLREWTSENS